MCLYDERAPKQCGRTKTQARPADWLIGRRRGRTNRTYRMAKTAAKGAYTQRPIRRPVGAFRSPFSVLRSPERHRRSSRGGGIYGTMCL